MQRYLGIFLLCASPKPSFAESPESGLAVHCTPSPDELAFSMVGLSEPVNWRLRTSLPSLSL
jgi:hypothetical protein